MKEILLRRGNLLDFSDGQDILIIDGKIVRIEKDILSSTSLDCKDLLVVPGLIDLHTHIRKLEDNSEEETIDGIIPPAISGGFTTICIMPNTNPVIDNPEILRKIKEKTREIQILPIGAITREMGGRKLSDIEGMKEEGIFAISDDGFPISDKKLLKDAFEIAKGLSLLVILHCEDERYSGCLSEVKAIERNISLALDTKSRLHIAHISTRDGVSLVREAKKEGKGITCEATPHHLILSDIEFNVKPPIRSASDRDALLEGLLDTTIDVIATDHAPHPEGSLKPGISGIETCLSLVITELVDKGLILLKDAIAKLTEAPSKIIGLERKIKEGQDAYLTIISLKDEWVVKKEDFISKGKNTPFLNSRLKGRARFVITPNLYQIFAKDNVSNYKMDIL